MLRNIVESFPAVTFRPLYYRNLERDTIRDLKYHNGNFEGKISLSVNAVSEIHWRINNIDNSCQHINRILNQMLAYTQMLVLQVGELSMG